MNRFSICTFVLFVSTFLFARIECHRNNKDEDFKDLLYGVADLASAFGSVFGETEECIFTCPKRRKAEQNPYHKPTTNGCGAYGIVVEDNWGFTECCRKHDFCYGTCNKKKKTCDLKFEACLNDICETLPLTRLEEEECIKTAKLYTAGVKTLGCDAYMDAQTSACRCV